jgi:cobalt-zinc-cadmium efflux system protein
MGGDGHHDDHEGHDHGDGRAHRHTHLAGPVRDDQRRVLGWVLAANGAALVVEVVGGLVFGSLALLADAAHLLSDVAGLGIALVAHALLTRPATTRHSYGLQRAEVLGAQANGTILLATTGWVIVEAIRRLGNPVHVHGGGLLAVALAGLAVNVGSAVALRRVQGESLNMRGAFWHMVADAAGSVAAVVAGIAVIVADATWVDPAASLVTSMLVLWATYGLLRDATHVLLEGTPRGMDPDVVAAAIAEHAGVEAVHHVHLWNLASDIPALSAHVVMEGEISLHDAQATGDEVRAVLAERFGIAHATLELECHECEVEPDHHPGWGGYQAGGWPKA